VEVKDIANEIRDARKHTSLILAQIKYKNLVTSLETEIGSIECHLEDLVAALNGKGGDVTNLTKGIAYRIGAIRGRLDE